MVEIGADQLCQLSHAANMHKREAPAGSAIMPFCMAPLNTPPFCMYPFCMPAFCMPEHDISLYTTPRKKYIYITEFHNWLNLPHTGVELITY